ncbi:MAG: hypothetical protein WCD86_05060 [Ktedonobacteraceae bacterium]
MQAHLSKITSIVARLNLPTSVAVSDDIIPTEGAVILVEALSDEGKNNTLEFANGRVGHLVQGDMIPAVLGKRRALREYSGDIPKAIAPGDILYLLCESGLVGEIRGLNAAWGVPMQVKVLGSIVDPITDKPLNIKDSAIARKHSLGESAPIIGVVGTCMNIGKTTTIRKLIKHFKSQGLKVAAAKLSGVASIHDINLIHDAGARPVLGFHDGGLPSTCGEAGSVVETALGILHELNQSDPDLIMVEFGDGILGEYNVEHLLRHPDIQQHICAFIVGAPDFVAAWGAREIMHDYGLPITLITGPVANNDTGTQYVERNLHLPAESNQHAMPKTIRLVEDSLSKLRVLAVA